MRDKKSNETIAKYKREIYETQRHQHQPTNTTIGLRIQNKFPNINWPIVWRNINKPFLLRYIRTIWYMIVHDIITTNVRLWKINLHGNGKCRQCDKYDTVTHRYTECINSQPIWDWTRERIACYMRISTREVKDTWISLPEFDMRPLKN